jgi:hypothetical protein
LFLRKIIETATLLYGPARSFYEFKMYALKRYQDHRRPSDTSSGSWAG